MKYRIFETEAEASADEAAISEAMGYSNPARRVGPCRSKSRVADGYSQALIDDGVEASADW
jgi:hypothetical protein